ncbi:MAG TPA: PLD nuclease N-terminal domain-containing protein [Lacisediminihabitans sp.]|uniref:PLD nuclease N-terminal domain-containing protein n=1 Tax=Lacisediminihabitans sp. TaxID=2787631 RepID=UPI002ED89CAD
MARVELILVLVFLAFTIFAFVDCIRTRDENVRALPKILWAVLIVLLSPFGGILWFALGKERSAGRPVQAQHGGMVAPDDDPAFLRRLGEDKAREERIRELEARLAELDDDQDKPKS